MTQTLSCSPETSPYTSVARAVTIHKVLTVNQSKHLHSILPGECKNFNSLSEQLNRLAPRSSLGISVGDLRSFFHYDQPVRHTDGELPFRHPTIFLAPRLIEIKLQAKTSGLTAFPRCSRSAASMSPGLRTRKRARSYSEEDLIDHRSGGPPKRRRRERAMTVPVPLRF